MNSPELKHDHRAPRMIDLKAHLSLPYGSLSPRALRSLGGEVVGEPLERIAAREEAHRFARRAQWFLVGFFVIVLAILSHHRALLPLLGL